MMDLATAMQIVLDLAKITYTNSPNVPEREQFEAKRALDMVEDFTVNTLGDD